MPSPALPPRAPALLLLLFLAGPLRAQPVETLVQVSVAPDHPDWRYRLGEPAIFHASVLRSGHPIPGAEVRYEVEQEQMGARSSGALALRDGRATVDAGTLREPGFLRCWVIASVDGKEYRGLATAAYEPERIQPTTTLPEDFAAFWESGIRQARELPLDARMTLLPEQSTAEVSVYHVSFQNERPGSRIYGILSMPAAPGRYPALLQVPGAGVRPYTGSVDLAKRGVILLTIGIHGVPVNLPQEVYSSLGGGPLRDYPGFSLDQRERYYYRRVYLGCVRAGDFLFSLPQFDGERYAVYGGSQGGALSIVTAALDPRVRRLAAVYPALSDLTGYLHGRAGGWPHLFSPANRALNDRPERIENSRYYDVVNFARGVRVPGFYTWGFNDLICPPTSMHAAYNVITAPKELYLVPETGHWTYPEQWDRIMAWLMG